jgi:hypothetical protein
MPGVMMKRWRLLLDMRRCFLANSESSEVREFHDLHMHRNCWRNFTGSLHRISATSSIGSSVAGAGSSFGNREFQTLRMNFTGSESWSDRLSVEVVSRCCTVNGGGGGVVIFFVISSGGVSVDLVFDNVTVI